MGYISHSFPIHYPIACICLMVNEIHILSHRIHGAGIYANMTGVYWWDPCYHSSTMDPMGIWLIHKWYPQKKCHYETMICPEKASWKIHEVTHKKNPLRKLFLNTWVIFSSYNYIYIYIILLVIYSITPLLCNEMQWRFPKIGVTPNHSTFDYFRYFSSETSGFGDPRFVGSLR